MVARDTKIAVACVLAILAVYAVAQTVGIGGVAGRFTGLTVRPVGYDASVEGTAVFRAETGMRDPVSGQCLDAVCQRAYTNVTVQVDGLPDVGEDLHYLAYLVRDDGGRTDYHHLGELTAEAGDGRWGLAVNQTGFDGRPWESIAVFLGSDPDPRGEPGPVLYGYEYGPLEGESPPQVNVSDRDLVSVRVPSAFRPVEDGVTYVLQEPSRYPGLTRCVWHVRGEGIAGAAGTGPNASFWVAQAPGYAGDHVLKGCSRVQEAWTWTRDEIEQVDAVVVTYEASEGASPQGWPLVRATLQRSA